MLSQEKILNQYVIEVQKVVTENIQRYIACFFEACICILICYVRSNNWWVSSEMLNLTLIKRLFSPEKAITALYFGGLDLTGLNYP